MKLKLNSPLLRTASLACSVLLIAYSAAPSAHAATIYWDGTATSWGTAANWSTSATAATPNPSAIPGASDVAVFSISTVNSAQAVTLDNNRSAQGLIFQGTNTATTSLLGGAANRVLTLGNSGITVNASAGAVTIGSATTNQNVSVTLAAGNQNWVNNSSNTLTIVNGVTRAIATGATLNFSGSLATPVTATTAFANTAGIVGTWASFGTGVNTKYATKNGSNQILGLTGTAAATGSDLTDTTGLVNYDLAAGGGTVPGTVSANTIRYTGAADALAPGATSFTLNGLMNSGTGTLTVGSNTLTIGANLELVANAANNDISISSIIQNNGATASALTKTGTGVLTLSGNNTYTGATRANLGTLVLSGDNSAATGATNVGAGGTLQVGVLNNFTTGVLTLNGSTTDTATLDLRNDSSTTFSKDVVLGGPAAGLHVINVDRAVGGSGTNGTHVLSSISNSGTVAARILTVNGANGYGLTIGNFNLQGGLGQNTTINSNVNVTLSDVTNPMTGFGTSNSDTLTLGGTATGSSVTGIIEDAVGGSVTAGGFTAVAKSGTGTWVLGNAANSFTGQIQVLDGNLSIGSIANSGTNSAAGAGLSMRIGNTITSGTLLYTGGNQLTNRQLQIGNGNGSNQSGGAFIQNNGSGALTFTNAAFTIPNTAATVGRTLNLGGTYTSSANEIQGVIANNSATGLISITKSGAGTWILSGANTYIGATAVNAGKLVVNGNQPLATGATTVAAGSLTATPVATLAGNGGIGGNLSLTGESASGFKNGGVLAPTASASGTALDVVGATTFGAGSIFEWSMSATTPATDPGSGTTNSGTYGQLAGAGLISGSGAVFNIVLGAGNSFTDAFWNTNKVWNNVFSGAGSTTNNLESIFSNFGGAGVTDTSGTGVTSRGTFTFTGTNTLNWTAVPEPSSALAGLLLGAGLLRRRRSA